MVWPSTQKALAVDARIVIDVNSIGQESGLYEHLVIAPYPNKYVHDWKLKNGALIQFRPIKPEDEGGFNELFKSLSAESMRFRFFHIMKELPHERLTRYCNLDYDREIAIVAELKSSRQLIGAGRVIAESDGKSGEFAVLVGDEWQGRGLGLKLMDYIINVAKDMRLERIFACVLSNNYKMLRLSEKKGFKLEMLDEETVKASLNLSD